MKRVMLVGGHTKLGSVISKRLSEDSLFGQIIIPEYSKFKTCELIDDTMDYYNPSCIIYIGYDKYGRGHILQDLMGSPKFQCVKHFMLISYNKLIIDTYTNLRLLYLHVERSVPHKDIAELVLLLARNFTKLSISTICQSIQK